MEALVDAIKLAFKHVSPPATDAIVSGSSPEHRDIQRYLRERHWSEIPVAKLRTISNLFLTPTAMQFFLPAYLLATIEEYHDADVIPHRLVSILGLEFNQGNHNAEKLARSAAYPQGAARCLTTLRDMHERLRMRPYPRDSPPPRGPRRDSEL